jgi:hypothetical protein
MAENDHQNAEIIKLCPQLYYSPQNVAARRAAAAESERRKRDTVRPPVDPTRDFLFVTTECGRPVIFENRDGRRLTNKQMLYPPPDGRDRYQAGDAILLGEFSKRMAERIFPELKPDEEEQTSLLILFAKVFLGIKPEKYKIGHRIVQIRPSMSGNGTGEIHTHALLFLGERDVIEMDADHEFSRRELADNFAMLIYGPKPEVAELLEKYCEFLTDIAGGLEKETIAGITKWGAKKAAKYAIKKEGKHLLAEWFKRLVTEESKALIKAIFASAKKFSSALLIQREQHRLKARLTKEPVEPYEFAPAISDASWELSKTLMDEGWEALVASFSKTLAKWLPVDEIFGESARRKILVWLAKKTTDGLRRIYVSGKIEALVKASNEARTDKEFEEISRKSWEESVKDFFKESVQEICKHIGEEAIKESE